MNVSAFQLFQTRPSGTSAAVIFTASQRTELTRIVVCNTTGTDATFKLFHDDDGTTVDESTALYYNVSVAANKSEVIVSPSIDGGITVSKDGTIGFATGTANALTITGYGKTAPGR